MSQRVCSRFLPTVLFLFCLFAQSVSGLERPKDWAKRLENLRFYFRLIFYNDGSDYWTEPIPYHVHVYSEKLRSLLKKTEPQTRLNPLLTWLEWLIPLSDYRVDDIFDQVTDLLHDVPAKDIQILQAYIVSVCPWPTKVMLDLERLRVNHPQKTADVSLPSNLINCQPNCTTPQLHFLAEWYRIHEVLELTEHYCNLLQSRLNPTPLVCLYNQLDLAEMNHKPVEPILYELKLHYPSQNSTNAPVSLLRYRLKGLLQEFTDPNKIHRPQSVTSICEALIELAPRYTENDSQADLYQRFFTEFAKFQDSDWAQLVECLQKHGPEQLALQWASRVKP